LRNFTAEIYYNQSGNILKIKKKTATSTM